MSSCTAGRGAATAWSSGISFFLLILGILGLREAPAAWVGVFVLVRA